MKVAVIGLGSITRGILAALSQVDEIDCLVGARRRDRADSTFPSSMTVLADDVHHGANVSAARGADVVVMCVKPHQVREVLTELSPALQPGAMVISVAAGITFDTLRSAAGPGVRLARLLPNTAAGVGKGVVGLLLQTPDSRWQDRLSAWFEVVGTVVCLPDERAVDALSAVAGSGPAYVFRLIEAMTHGAIGLGFDPDEAAHICRQVVIGASALLEDAPSVDASALRSAVTSRGGTTEQAMGIIDQASPETLMSAAFAASVNHAARLGSVEDSDASAHDSPRPA